MNTSESAKILEVAPYTFDEGGKDHIIEAYLKMKVNELTVHCDVYLRKYFPYYPKPSKWGVGEQLVKNLVGKKIKVDFLFIDLKHPTHATAQRMAIDQTKRTDKTKIHGRIIQKVPKVEANNENAKKQGLPKVETLILDCGLKTRLNISQKDFKIGDFIEATGILTVKILEIEGEKIQEDPK
jgi:hypothetical protein